MVRKKKWYQIRIRSAVLVVAFVMGVLFFFANYLRLAHGNDEGIRWAESIGWELSYDWEEKDAPLLAKLFQYKIDSRVSYARKGIATTEENARLYKTGENDLQPISMFPYIEKVEIRSSRFPLDRSINLKPLRNLGSLRQLKIVDLEIQNSKTLESIPNLQSLFLSGKVNAIQFQHFFSLRHLTSLTIQLGPDVESIDVLDHFRNLKSLSVQGDFLDIGTVCSLPNLQSLTITSSRIYDCKVPLSNSLQKVRLDGASILDNQFFTPNKNLTHLVLHQCEWNGLPPLVDRFPNLRLLSLCDSKFRDGNLLAGLTRLEHLDLRSTEITCLDGIRNLSNLKSLDCRTEKLRSLGDLSQLKKLEQFHILGKQLTDPDSVEILPSLKYLDSYHPDLDEVALIVQIRNQGFLPFLWDGTQNPSSWLHSN